MRRARCTGKWQPDIISEGWYGRLNNGPPKMSHVPIPGIWEYVTLHSIRDLENVIKHLSYADLSKWAHYNHKCHRNIDDPQLTMV